MTQYKLLIIILLLCTSTPIFGQMESYDYKRQLNGVSEQWHKIILPNAMFTHISEQVNDLRIYGITAEDTIEAPYLLRLTKEKIDYEKADFELINQTKKGNGYYFTFEVPKPTTLNQLELDFEQQNYDWRIRLEGSQNQREWVTILENYRILSIQNVLTNYSFSRLSFSNAKYRYFRIFIPNNEKPQLKSANLSLQKVIAGNLQAYRTKSLTISENKAQKQTEIFLELEDLVAVSELKIEVKNTFDYYRPIKIQGLIDSTKTEKGWIENYQHLTLGVLNLMEENRFQFQSQAFKKFKIIIRNADNEPLQIGDIEAKGYFYELVARFTEQADYYLVYGKKNDVFPQYDIARFSTNIPENLSILKLGKAEKIPKIEQPQVSPLFENELWLWVIMLIIILMLGGFTINMVKK